MSLIGCLKGRRHTSDYCKTLKIMICFFSVKKMASKKKKIKIRKRNKRLVAVLIVIMAVLMITAMKSAAISQSDSKSINKGQASGEISDIENDQNDNEENVDEENNKEHVFTVVIDAGHGGSDPGSVVGNMYESEQVLEIALLVRDYLATKDINVIMTRTTDEYIDLYDRVAFANDNDADVLLSIHRNFYDGRERIYGIEAWIHSNEPKKAVTLSDFILDRLSAVEGTNIRGLRTGTSENSKENYIINRESNMPSLILEMGYMSDSSDNKLLENNKKAYAKAIGLGILDYKESVAGE